MFSPATAVHLLVYVTLLTTPGARAFVVPYPQTMSKQAESTHAASVVGHQAHGDEDAGGTCTDIAVARLGVQGLGGLASQYDAFLIGKVGFDQASPRSCSGRKRGTAGISETGTAVS